MQVTMRETIPIYVHVSYSLDYTKYFVCSPMTFATCSENMFHVCDIVLLGLPSTQPRVPSKSISPLLSWSISSIMRSTSSGVASMPRVSIFDMQCIVFRNGRRNERSRRPARHIALCESVSDPKLHTFSFLPKRWHDSGAGHIRYSSTLCVQRERVHLAPGTGLLPFVAAHSAFFPSIAKFRPTSSTFIPTQGSK